MVFLSGELREHGVYEVRCDIFSWSSTRATILYVSSYSSSLVTYVRYGMSPHE